VERELITKRGSFYSYGDERLGQGRENAKQYLRDHPELATTIEGEIRAAIEN
jgi:recombination protein RecA